MQRVISIAQTRGVQGREPWVEVVLVDVVCEVTETEFHAHALNARTINVFASSTPAGYPPGMGERQADPTAPGAPTALVGQWRELLDRHAAVSCALEKALQDEHQLGLSEFETLERVVDANCGKYRMSDLAGDIHLSQSALSRAVARLERDGLVERSICADDRRGIFVCLTEKGRQVYERALPTHRSVLSRTWGVA